MPYPELIVLMGSMGKSSVLVLWLYFKLCAIYSDFVIYPDFEKNFMIKTVKNNVLRIARKRLLVNIA